MLRRVRIGLGLIILVISIPLLTWGFWPVSRETRIRPVSFTSELALPEKRILTLIYPPRIRAGEASVVKLTLGVDTIGTLAPTDESGETGQSSDSPDIFDTHRVIAEARFDIPEMNVRPSELISAPISRNQTAVFYWTLRPRGVGQYRGTIWLYLRTVDRLTGEENRETISAQLVQIESTKLLGFNVSQVRIVGFVSFILGCLLCIPLLSVLIWNLMQKGVKSHKIG